MFNSENEIKLVLRILNKILYIKTIYSVVLIGSNGDWFLSMWTNSSGDKKQA